MNSTTLSLVLSLGLMMLVVIGFFVFLIVWTTRLQNSHRDALSQVLSLTQSSISEHNRTISRAQSLIAAGDPLAFQQIAAMDNTPVEDSPYVGVSEMDEAAREAAGRGFVFDPLSLEDDVYDAGSIERFLNGDTRSFFGGDT